jgi:hypothetical protein
MVQGRFVDPKPLRELWACLCGDGLRLFDLDELIFIDVLVNETRCKHTRELNDEEQLKQYRRRFDLRLKRPRRGRPYSQTDPEKFAALVKAVEENSLDFLCYAAKSWPKCNSIWTPPKMNPIPTYSDYEAECFTNEFLRYEALSQEERDWEDKESWEDYKRKANAGENLNMHPHYGQQPSVAQVGQQAWGNGVCQQPTIARLEQQNPAQYKGKSTDGGVRQVASRAHKPGSSYWEDL